MTPAQMLTVELVPETAWWSNVRSNVTRGEWEKCKNFVKERSGSKCEICGGVGTRYPVDCHEIWSYDEETGVQKLEGLIALCPPCHEVKHLGRAFATGNAVRALMHLSQVNGWGAPMVEAYAERVFKVWERRSQMQWKLDISYLDEIGVKVREGSR